MASVELQSILVAPVSDLSATVALEANTTDETTSRPLDVRAYAGGRRRVIRRAGTDRVVMVGCPYVERAAWRSLVDLVGELVLFRDTRGRKVYGVFGDVQAGETLGADLLESVTFTVTEVTYSEVV